MKDIHSHLLYGIDDGSRDLEESIELLLDMERQGITDVILTPHYIENSRYTATPEEKQKRLEELERYTNIKLYLGNEVYLSDNIPKLLEEKKISTLNNSRYLLVEFPMNNKIRNVASILYELIRKNIIPIVAHPERYTYVQDDIHYLDELVEMGVLFQGNYESLYGKYGKKSEKTLKRLLQGNYISFLGSDIHRRGYRYHHSEIEKKLSKVIKEEEKRKDLISRNMERVINNEEIENT